MLEPNPYAPPAVTLDARVSDAPLPPGVRRFRLNPARFDRFARIVLVQLLFLMIPILGLCSVMMGLAGISPGTIATFVAVFYAWIIVARMVRVRMVRRSNLESYELLVTDRAARRNLSGWVSAEILRPEITHIVEVPTGLWLQSDAPARALFVASAVDGFEDARAMFASWHPIETRGGFSGWNFARRNARRQGPRDEIAGTALARDESLTTELAMLQSMSTTAGAAHAPSRYAMLLRMLVIWFALVFFFLGIWQYFSGPR